jgi:type IX secretion system PorP/SprF family membrane protein
MMRIKTLVFVVCLIVCFGFDAKSQFESASPSIPNQEYFNPAFNAYKEYSSVNMMSRWQWVNVASSPKFKALNAYVPLAESGLGFALNFVSEDIGLRDINTLLVSISKGMSLSANSYLSFGLSLGAELEAYKLSELKYYPELDVSGISENSSKPALSIGMLMMLSNYYVGVSTNLVMNKNDFDFKYITGFDFVTGAVFVYTRDLVFRTSLKGKYYKQTRYNSNNGEITNEFVAPTIDWSVSCFLLDKFWIGTGLRVGQALTFSVNTRINKQFNVAYKYEMGTGSGLNQFDSQGIYLGFNFRQKKKRASYRGVFGHRYKFSKYLNNYLY